MGTRGSIATMSILEDIAEEGKTEIDVLAEKFVQVFQSPTDFMRYLKSSIFAHELIRVCQEVSAIFEEEPKCLFMQSPVYVLGKRNDLQYAHNILTNLFNPYNSSDVQGDSTNFITQYHCPNLALPN